MEKEKKILVGKVYANWCVHCQDLKPVWKELKERLKKKSESLGLTIEFVEIEASDKTKLENFKKSNPGLKDDSYPTIFKIKEGKDIEYYDKERELDKMERWVLGDYDNSGKTMGGKRKKSKTTKKGKKAKKTKSERKTRKHRKTSKKTTFSRITSLFSFGK